MQESRSLLQPKRDGGTVDSRGKECGEMDKALMPRLRGQPCAIAIVRPGLQPRQLLAAAGSAASHEDLDDDDLAGKVDQDRGQSGSACQVRNLPDGGGGGPVSAVPSDPRTDTTTRHAVAEGNTDMTVANRLPAQPTTRGRKCHVPSRPPKWPDRASKPPFLHDSAPPSPFPEVNPRLELEIRAGGVILVLEPPGGVDGRMLIFSKDEV